MSDLIDRAAEIDITWEEPSYTDPLNVLTEVRDRLRALPSAPPEPQWIPCSETVDIPDHEVMACDKYGEEMFGYLAYEDEQWLCASDGCVMYNPIAWREKPEPYQEEGDA